MGLICPGPMDLGLCKGTSSKKNGPNDLDWASNTSVRLINEPNGLGLNLF